MKLSNKELSSCLMLPAVAGYSDIGMRMLAKRYGAGLTFTEMVSAKGLLYGNENTEALLATHESEDILGVQLFGREPEIISKAIRNPLLQKFDVIDINCGCPVPKIVKNGEGSALMKEPCLVYSIVKEAVKAAEGRAVTVKLRAGFSSDNKNAEVVGAAAEDGGASLITVHGRTQEMMYSGVSDTEIIRKVKEKVKIPVFANGDITDRESYLRVMRETLADGVAIARGAFGRPWVFSEVLKKEVEVNIPEIIKEHIETLEEILPEKVLVNNMKKHIAFYLKGQRNVKKNRVRIYKAETKEEMLTEVFSIFAEESI